MELRIQDKLLEIIQIYKKQGPQWKPGKDLIHLNKRISRRDVSVEFTLLDYNKLIVNVVTNENSDIHIYHLDSFQQSYFAFSANNWVVIIGENEIMETAMKTSFPERYLSEEKGYTYLGTVKEVLS